jgi:hypothetical protein
MASNLHDSPDFSIRPYNPNQFKRSPSPIRGSRRSPSKHSPRFHDNSTNDATTTYSDISANDILTSEHAILQESIHHPEILVGWNVIVKGHGSGLITALEQHRFSGTRYKVQFESGKIESLPLKRSERKGNLPFVMISKSSKY